jgi:hypothetical protein
VSVSLGLYHSRGYPQSCSRPALARLRREPDDRTVNILGSLGSEELEGESRLISGLRVSVNAELTLKAGLYSLNYPRTSGSAQEHVLLRQIMRGCSRHASEDTYLVCAEPCYR